MIKDDGAASTATVVHRNDGFVSFKHVASTGRSSMPQELHSADLSTVSCHKVPETPTSYRQRYRLSWYVCCGSSDRRSNRRIS